MLITLLFFIIGSVIGTAHMGWWTAQPAFPATSIVTTMGPWAALAASLALFGAHRVDHDGRRAKASRPAGDDETGEPSTRSGRRTAMAERTVAAGRRRGRTRGRQHRHADDRRTALGRDLGIRAVGREVVCRARHRRRVVALLDGACAGHGAQVERADGRHVGDGFRHHPRRVDGGDPRRPLRAGVEDLGTLAGRRGDRRPAARLRRAHRLRLQHRRVLQRHRLRQPARLAVAGRRVRRQHRRHAVSGRCSI